MSIPSVSHPPLCFATSVLQRPEEAQSGKGPWGIWSWGEWVLYVTGTKNPWGWKMCLQHPSSRCWCRLLLGSCLPARLLPAPAICCCVPSTPTGTTRSWQRAGHTGTMAEPSPAFGCVPFLFPLPGSDTGEQLDPDRMP